MGEQHAKIRTAPSKMRICCNQRQEANSSADLWGTKSIVTVALQMSPKAKWQKVQRVVINFIT